MVDQDATWRIVYSMAPDGIRVREVFAKQGNQTPTQVIEICRRRLTRYDR